MNYLDQIITVLSVVIFILIIGLIVIITYIRKYKRHTPITQVNVDESDNQESMQMLEQNNPSVVIINDCGDIMQCHCAFNVSKMFNGSCQKHSTKDVEYAWKEGNVIGETFNCEIRKVDLLVINKELCTRHTGGVVKKLKHKDTWNNEYHVYQLPGLRHDNVLLFLDAYRHSGGEFRYSLITAEAACGSLYSYLMGKPRWTDFMQYFRILRGIVCGLAHLHSGEGTKPPIVHRDLKSKNILLKADLTPCIADFGLALPLIGPMNIKDPDYSTVRVGTQRYMSPEILEGTTGNNLTAYVASDVYALALVLWEVSTQCPWFAEETMTLGNKQHLAITDIGASGTQHNVATEVGDYCLPYTAELNREMPTLEALIHLVVLRKLRPRPQAWWILNKYLKNIWTSIQECWEQIPEERISASLFLERLKLMENEFVIV